MNLKNSIGFSLLEIVIAMLIMSLVVTGMFGFFVTSHKYIVEAGHRLAAVNYARMIADSLKVHVTASPTTDIGHPLDQELHTPDDLGISPIDIPGITGENCTYTVTNDPLEEGATDLKQASIEVTWTEQ